jgi:hypothetical protein
MDHIKEVLFDLIIFIWVVEAGTFKMVATTESLVRFFILFHSSILAVLT